MFVIGLIKGGQTSSIQAALSFLWQLGGGVGICVGIGFLAVYVFK